MAQDCSTRELLDDSQAVLASSWETVSGSLQASFKVRSAEGDGIPCGLSHACALQRLASEEDSGSSCTVAVLLHGSFQDGLSLRLTSSAKHVEVYSSKSAELSSLLNSENAEYLATVRCSVAPEDDSSISNGGNSLAKSSIKWMQGSLSLGSTDTDTSDTSSFLLKFLGLPPPKNKLDLAEIVFQGTFAPSSAKAPEASQERHESNGELCSQLKGIFQASPSPPSTPAGVAEMLNSGLIQERGVPQSMAVMSSMLKALAGPSAQMASSASLRERTHTAEGLGMGLAAMGPLAALLASATPCGGGSSFLGPLGPLKKEAKSSVSSQRTHASTSGAADELRATRSRDQSSSGLERGASSESSSACTAGSSSITHEDLMAKMKEQDKTLGLVLASLNKTSEGLQKQLAEIGQRVQKLETRLGDACRCREPSTEE